MTATAASSPISLEGRRDRCAQHIGGELELEAKGEEAAEVQADGNEPRRVPVADRRDDEPQEGDGSAC